jgi:hypothetical protein
VSGARAHHSGGATSQTMPTWTAMAGQPGEQSRSSALVHRGLARGEWTTSAQAFNRGRPARHAIYAEGYAVVAIPELAQPIEYMPDDLQSKMIDNDFDWAASNRERILAEWQRRYDAKTEPEG